MRRLESRERGKLTMPPAAVTGRLARWLHCAALLCVTATAAGAWAGQQPNRVGARPPALQVRLELSASSVEFLQQGRPGLILASRGSSIQVTCFSQSWSVVANATPLRKRLGDAQIGPERLFIRSNPTRPEPDTGAGDGFVSLDVPVVVAQGSVPVYETALEFRLLTDWSDTPGLYEGEIQFTAVARP